MAGKKKRSFGLVVGLIAGGGTILVCGGFCCLSGLWGGADLEADRALIEQNRAACGSPNVFRLREGGLESIPGDWDCISPDQAADEERARSTAEPPAQLEAAGEGPSAEPIDTRPGAAADESARSDDEAAGEPSIWASDSLVEMGPRCPDGMWALVPGYTPGADDFERRTREPQREALAAGLREERFHSSLRAGAVTLGDYDFRRHRYPVEIEVSFSCRGLRADGISISLGQARIDTMRERVGRTVSVERSWVTRPHRTFLSISEERAPALIRPAGGGLLDTLRGPPTLRAEVVFEYVRGRLDRRMTRDALGETDTGAGPLVEGRLVALRIVNSRNDEVLLDTAAE